MDKFKLGGKVRVLEVLRKGPLTLGVKVDETTLDEVRRKSLLTCESRGKGRTRESGIQTRRVRGVSRGSTRWNPVLGTGKGLSRSEVTDYGT